MRKKRILADYAHDVGADGKPSYRYEGPLYSLHAAPAAWKRYLLAAWLAPVLGLVLLIAMGLLNSEGTRVIYVALPYVSIFLPVFLLFGDAYKVTRARHPMRRAEYERSVVQMRRATVAALVLSLCVLAGQGVLLLVSGWNGVEFAFFACGLALSVLWAVFRRAQRAFVDAFLRVDAANA